MTIRLRRAVRALCWTFVALSVAAAGPAPGPREKPAPPGCASACAAAPAPLPPEVTTQHSIVLPTGTLHFAATAGGLRLRAPAKKDGEQGPVEADLAFIAFTRDGADPRTRPVTFVFNGGPGMASGWLNVGAVGPWRIRFDASTTPSTPPHLVPNADTWLDFTDLVFIDPPDTGFSRILGGEAVRRRLWSVDGDVKALADAIRDWLQRTGRVVSPKYILGESYGGFRGPRLVRALQSKDEIGVSGLVLISPELDFGGRSRVFDPLYWVERLPSMVAAARALHGPVTRASLADVEHYAETDYLIDLVRGESDPAAVARISKHVAALTGLDPSLVARAHGRLENEVFLRALYQAQDRIGSPYDATLTSRDPFPEAMSSLAADPVLDRMEAPVSEAMLAVYRRLGWRPETIYHLANETAFHDWNWGRRLTRPESLVALQTAMALDPDMRVLIAAGLYDLVTPYFATQLLLDALPPLGRPDALRFVVYPAGHMVYTNPSARTALHADAAWVYQGR